MPIALEAAAFNLVLALFCGALIGSERQVRQRMAGLRTNALVALGAASFVVFSGLFPEEVSPTRVGAQVVSGIGFLGAGIIFRHGFTIHGLNTAATLWCSAAVGMIAGASAPLYAILVTGLVVFINLGLRPLVKWLKRKTNAGAPMVLEYRLTVSCVKKDEAIVRERLMNALAVPEMQVTGIEGTLSADGDVAEIEVLISAQGTDDALLKTALNPLMLDPKFKSLGWESSLEG